MNKLILGLLVMCLMIIGGCTDNKLSTENRAKKQLELAMAEFANDPSSVELSNIQTVWSGDSAVIFHLDVSGNNGLGNRISNKMEYVYSINDGKEYELLWSLTDDCVFQDLATWETTKDENIYKNLTYNDAMLYRVYHNINKFGKQIGEKDENLRVRIPLPTNTGDWDLGFAKDKFGDKTEEKFLRLSCNGVFSNSATTNSSLLAFIFVYKSHISLRLIEYDTRVVKDMGYYKVRIKGNAGREYPEMTFFNANGDLGPENLDESTYKELLSILENNHTLYFNIIDPNYSISEYQFKAYPTGLKEALKML